MSDTRINGTPPPPQLPPYHADDTVDVEALSDVDDVAVDDDDAERERPMLSEVPLPTAP